MSYFVFEVADNIAGESAESFKSNYPHFTKAIKQTYCVVRSFYFAFIFV